MSSEDDRERSGEALERSTNERDSPPTATTDEAFHEALRALVFEADSNGVDVRGSWPVARVDETRAWDVEVTRVSRPSTARVDDSRGPVASVREAVATREGVETADLPPLRDAVDTDVLRTLLRDGDDETDPHLRFQYYGYEVTVRSEGSIRLDG